MATKRAYRSSGAPLTPKQERFVQALPLASSATAAAIEAGYSPVSAAESASQSLRLSNVRAAMLEQFGPEKFAAILNVVERKERLSRLAQSDPDHPDPVAAIKELNRMESIGIAKSVSLNVNLDLQAELTQTFSVDELRALLGKMGA